MTKLARLFVLSLLAVPALALADAKVGEPAPDFTLKDSNNKTVKLSDHAGKDIVVLEWLNFDCPFVRKHYDTKNMQGLQEKYTGKGVKWYSIVSSGPGQEGNFPPKELNARNKKDGGHMTAILMDYDGKVGKAYGAKTTPHMFVIGKDGKIAYMGGIDDKKSTDKEDVKTAKNFVAAALDEMAASKAVTVASAPAYGCSVHYASK
jgi:peroxiredoxin